MTVSDQDTKMDVDTVTPIDTHGAHTHLADPSLTLKDSSQPLQPPASFISTDATAPSHPPNNPESTAKPTVPDQQPQQSEAQPVEQSTPSTAAVTAPENSTAVAHDVDYDGDEDLYRSRHPSAVFRPQLDDIVMDQDLLDFYEQLKFLVSLSPLKTAQVLYAFSLATEHLSPELEIRRSVLDMSRRAFSFYQENTWFTVDLESNEDLSDDEAYESSDPKFKILPARHGLFPALQKQPFGYQSNPAYYNPYPPYPNYHDYPYPYFGELGHYLPDNEEPRATSPGHKNDDGGQEQERRPRDRERSSRSHRRGTKSSKRRRSRDSESSVRPSGSVTKIRLRTSGYDDRSAKKSRRDPDSPSLSSMDGVRKHHRRGTETGDANMDLTQQKDPERRRDKERDADYEKERMERRLARKLKKQARAGEHASGDRQKDNGQSQTKIRPLKITLVQSGKSASNSAAQDSTTDGGGHDASKSSQSWNPNVDHADGADSSHAHRSIQPQNAHASASADNGISTSSAQRPAAINTQAPQPIPRKPKHAHALQSSPVQTMSTNGGQTAPGPLSSDKSDDKLKKGTWTAAEEEILLEAVRGLSSENWHAVAQMVPGRNAKQCMQKWQTDLDPQINRLPWTEAEDEKLVEAYHRYGNSWQQIAKMVETRTWYQCYNRVRAKSVKTKIQQTTGTHPASIANGGIPGGPRPEGSKPGSKRDGEKRKGHGSQGGMTSGLASGPSMESQPQSGSSQPRPPLNGESSTSSSNNNSGEYIRMKGQQGVLALGPSVPAQGAAAGHRDLPTSSPSQGPPSTTEGTAPTTSSSDYHRSSPMSGRQQDVPQSQGVKAAPSTPSQSTSQAQFQPPQHLHSPQQSHQQHHSQHQQSPQQRPLQHQPSQSLKPIKTEPQQPSTPQPKPESGYWPKQPASSSSPRPGSPKGYRTPQHSQGQQQQQQQPSPHRPHNHNISPAQAHSPSPQSQHHHQQGMQPPPPPSSHSNYPSKSPGPTAIHMTYESQSSGNGSSGGTGTGKSGGAGLGIHQSYSSQQQAPVQQQQTQQSQQQQQHSSPYQQHQQHHRQQPSPQQHQQQSPQQSQQPPHYRQKSSNGHLRPVPPLSATLSKGQTPSSAGSSSPSVSMQPQHGHRPPMSQKSHSSYSPSTLPPIQQHHATQQQQQQQSPKAFSGSQRLPSFNGPSSSSASSPTVSSSSSSPHPLLPPVQAHSQQLPPFQGQRQQQQGPPTPSPPPPQALGSQSSSSSMPYSAGPPPSIVTSAKMTPPGPSSGAHSTYSTPVLAPPLLSPTIANSPTGGFISTSALLMMARNAQQQQQQHRQSPGGGSNNSAPSASIPPP